MKVGVMIPNLKATSRSRGAYDLDT